LDESNDVSDAVQLLVFICGIGDKFSLYEELATISSLHETTTGDDLFMKVKETLNSSGQKWRTLKNVMMDGVKDNVW
jgi:hypothetical protein